MQENRPAAGAVRRGKARKITVTAMLSAIAAILMLVELSVPLMPEFIKLDISELPALLAAFSLGPVYGTAVCLVKNIIKALLMTTTGGVGELCNFLLGICFVLPAGFIYKAKKSRAFAALGAVAGAIVMAAVSVPLNYYLTYPIYQKFLPLDAIIAMYQAFRPETDGLLDCLLIFNMPFTFFKGFLDAVLCFLIYKPLSPILHGRKKS